MESQNLIEYFSKLKITNNNQIIEISKGICFNDIKRYIDSCICRMTESTSARIVSLAHEQLVLLKKLIDNGTITP